LISVIAGVSTDKGSGRNERLRFRPLTLKTYCTLADGNALYLYDAEKFLTADVKFETLTDTLLQAESSW